jgi:Condensation domain
MTGLLFRPVRRPTTYYQRDWVLACRDGRSYYSLPLAWDLVGPLDVAALTRAVGDLALRHDALRTAFEANGSDVDQVVWPEVHIDLALESTVEDLEGRIVAEAERTRVLAVAPLWHGRLFRLGEERHVLALFVHHLIFDGWSHGVLHDELVRCYRGRTMGRQPRLPTLMVQAGDHAQREREHRDVAAESWWRESLRSLPPPAALPPLGGRFVSAPLPLISAGQAQSLRAIAAEAGAGLNSALLAAVLSARRAIAGDDAVVGVTRAGRDRPELQRVVGPLLDHLPVRVNLSGAGTFPHLLARTHRAFLEAAARPLPVGRIRHVLTDDLTARGGRLYDVRYNYLPHAATNHALVSTSDGRELRISPYPVDPLRLAPRHTEDHPEVLPLSYVLRRYPGGEIGGEVCGHDALYPPHRLADVAEVFAETLGAVAVARPPVSVP